MIKCTSKKPASNNGKFVYQVNKGAFVRYPINFFLFFVENVTVFVCPLNDHFLPASSKCLPEVCDAVFGSH